MSSVSGATATAPNATTTTSTGTADSTSDRFLKLLVAQMQNQDPMNPMDNAQVTSQMAQINTVSGIEKLNTSVASLSGQFMQMMALQGAALVGKSVIVEGNALAVADSVAQGGFELATPADKVTVKIKDADGNVLDTLDMGKQLAGKHGFDWPADKVGNTTGMTFEVTASSGTTPLTVSPLMRDTVNAVSSSSAGTLTLDLAKSGSVAYADVKAFN